MTRYLFQFISLLLVLTFSGCDLEDTNTLNEDNAQNDVVDNGIQGNNQYVLIGWNDLGMHCVDGKDYSVFSILPPYNNLHAHLVDRNTATGKLKASDVTLSYESVADATGSINTSSNAKTNFWDWVMALFGGRPADNHGLNLSDPLVSNPTPNSTPAPMSYNASKGWWEAEGIPITPYDDNGLKNYYPMVKIVAKNKNGSILATTKVVLPVSDEMNCISCHSSKSKTQDAKPSTGWVNNPVTEKDWKQNILKLHDEKFPTAIVEAKMTSKYTKDSLLETSNQGQPILCASCHKSNALGSPKKDGIKTLTEVLHGKHALVKDEITGQTLNSSTNRDSCYKCHPGSTTTCLRGAMGKAKNMAGVNSIDCQSCHGTMSDVGSVTREGWLDQPNCQQCHDRNGSATANFTRHTSVFSSNKVLRKTIDRKFATNADTPMSGKSLYRFSKGHGNMQCESCHGSTHAEYPSSHANDNIQSIDIQGHSGAIGECSTCHSIIPTGTSNFNKGPHGMHLVGQGAISAHQSIAEDSTESCKQCHGNDYRGTVLSKTFTNRVLKIEDRTKTFSSGHMVSCYDCHNGPNP